MKRENTKMPTLKGMLISKCVIGSVINGAVNAGIFYLLNMKHEGVFYAGSLYFDFALTVAILGIVVSLLAFPSLKKAAKKGKAPSLTCHGFNYSLASVMPKNKWALMGVVTGVVTLLVPAFFVGVCSGLGLVPTTIVGAMALKGAVCAVAAGVINYFCIVSRLHVTTTCTIKQNAAA